MDSFKGKTWLITGSTAGAAFDVNTVWSTTNGTTWDTSNSIPGGARSGAGVAVFNDGKMYLIGGRDTGIISRTEVFSTADGVTWIQQSTLPAKRSYAAVFAY